MFKVYHDMTHYEWSVDTKDELLSELDILNARVKNKQITDTIHIRHEHEGDVLETKTLELPVHDDVDNYLVGFGESAVANAQKRGGMFNAFKRLLSRGKNKTKDTEHSDKEIDFVYGKDKPVLHTKDGEHEHVNISKIDIPETSYYEYDTVKSNETKHVSSQHNATIHDVDNIEHEHNIRDTTTHHLDDFVQNDTKQHTVDILGNNSDDFDIADIMTDDKEIARGNIIFDVANTSSKVHHLDDFVQHDTQKYTVEFLGDKSENFETTDTMMSEKMAHENDEAVIVTEDKKNTRRVDYQKTVYLTKDTVPTSKLQREFMQRVAQEIAFIDETVANLLANRKEKEKLLHVLEHFDTMEE